MRWLRTLIPFVAALINHTGAVLGHGTSPNDSPGAGDDSERARERDSETVRVGAVHRSCSHTTVSPALLLTSSSHLRATQPRGAAREDFSILPNGRYCFSILRFFLRYVLRTVFRTPKMLSHGRENSLLLHQTPFQLDYNEQTFTPVSKATKLLLASSCVTFTIGKLPCPIGTTHTHARTRI